jgi:hypothetical protein
VASQAIGAAKDSIARLRVGKLIRADDFRHRVMNNNDMWLDFGFLYI